MPKKESFPRTRVKNPEPSQGHDDWVIWAAWADRITFEEIFERTGLKEAEVIALMRKSLKSQSFKRWRKRVHEKVSIKHRRKFVLERRQEQKWGLENFEA
jgi:uncharacterized protein (TIGR03643 family)